MFVHQNWNLNLYRNTSKKPKPMAQIWKTWTLNISKPRRAHLSKLNYEPTQTLQISWTLNPWTSFSPTLLPSKIPFLPPYYLIRCRKSIVRKIWPLFQADCVCFEKSFHYLCGENKKNDAIIKFCLQWWNFYQLKIFFLPQFKLCIALGTLNAALPEFGLVE